MTDDPLPLAPLPPHLPEAAVYCSDPGAAEASYGGVLRRERIQRVGRRHVFFRVGPGVLLVFNPDETVKLPGHAGATAWRAGRRACVPGHAGAGAGCMVRATGSGGHRHRGRFRLAQWRTIGLCAGLRREFGGTGRTLALGRSTRLSGRCARPRPGSGFCTTRSTRMTDRPFTVPDLRALSAVDAVALLRRGAVSPREMLDAA